MKTLKNSLLRGRQKRGSVASISSNASSASTFSTASTIPEISIPSSAASSSNSLSSDRSVSPSPPSSFSPFSSFSSSPPVGISSPRSPLQASPPTSRSPEPSADGGLRGGRSAQPARMVNVEGWLELRYGEGTTKREVVELVAGSPERRYWFQLMGGFLTWFAQEDHNFAHHRHLGRIDLKNDVVEMRDVTQDQETKHFRITLVTEEAVHRKEVEELEVRGKTIAKTSVKNVVERCEYLLCTPDELVIYRWRDALNRAVRRRAGASSPTPVGARISAGSTFGGGAAPTTPLGGRTSLDVPERAATYLTRATSPQPSGLKSPPTPSPPSSPSEFTAPPPRGMNHSASSGFSPAASSSTISDNRGRLVKQQGFLELETKVEVAGTGEVLSLTKATFWLELLGGYLVWYDRQNHTGQPIGRIQVKAGDSVGELLQSEVGGKKVCSFTFATMEEIHRREEQVKDGNQNLFVKTTLKKERTTYTLSSSDLASVSEWRAQVSAMARRKIVSSK